MSRLGTLAAAVLACGCVAPSAVAPPATLAPTSAAAPGSVVLRNADFEAGMEAQRRCPPGWDCLVHNDPAAFRFFSSESAASGQRSLCVERVANEPWALVQQLIPAQALRGARLRLSIAVRVEGTTGEGAGPWLLIRARQQLHQQRPVNRSSGWERLAIDMVVPMDATEIVVGATLLGPGRACFDDVRLEVLRP